MKVVCGKLAYAAFTP
ncbi:hypothetical protein OC512_21255 [Vibrio vulnificus]|nr:hypothetical protein [Vibrio vulnificus]MCU8361135.1 hypothetical protein [Vibrio vulnificus]MCU8404420.1 hypothetical protein [Vibrio vulnificus]